MMCAFVRTKLARTNRREKNRFHKICYLIQVLAELAFHISSAWHKGAKITGCTLTEGEEIHSFQMRNYSYYMRCYLVLGFWFNSFFILFYFVFFPFLWQFVSFFNLHFLFIVFVNKYLLKRSLFMELLPL